jgi:VIT1/CCC1 family predicted Fe2+/Mn2+ transporter
MVRLPKHAEAHSVDRLGWLRAAVLGANDGILSTSSLIIGVASANGTHQSVLIAGLSGLVAGAMSMASGEYVSVSSQSDSETADIAREGRELRDNRPGETRELADIYVKRGLDTTLAMTVAEQLMAHDALGAHTRDELGISDMTSARPIQAALASAAAFSAGGAPPVLIALVAPIGLETVTVSVASLALLIVLGAGGAKAGGAGMIRAAVRVTFWGALAMGRDRGHRRCFRHATLT